MHIGIIGRFRYERKRHYLSYRKTTIIEVFGEERWNSFIPKLAAKDKFFSNTIWAITSIPMDNFILFLDELVKEFFDNDIMQYVTFGKLAAQFALSSEGPYKSYLLTKDTKQFAKFVCLSSGRRILTKERLSQSSRTNSFI